jgi:uncharacterized membrane-anchored protein
MKTSILLILQSVLLFAVLTILIDGLIRVPDIEMVHIIIRALGVAVVTGNFSYTLYSYLNEK